jgi:membrane protein
MHGGLLYRPMSARSQRSGLLSTVLRRFREENMAQVSGSLAFTTLLSLVPLVTVVLALVSAFPIFDVLVGRLDNLFIEHLLPSKSGGTIANYILQFARKANNLTVAGIVMLGVTSFLLLHTIERVFNHLWQVRQPRPLFYRLRLYCVVMVAGPLVIGAVVTLMTYVVTASLGFLDEPPAVRRVVLKLSVMLLLGFFFAFLYYAVPNARVRRGHALAGGAVASIAFALMQKGFELYIARFAVYATVYGTFAVLPIFLVWLYLSWTVVMVGGLLAATLDDLRPGRRGGS